MDLDAHGGGGQPGTGIEHVSRQLAHGADPIEMDLSRIE
jgi:hypothetical protein